MEGLDGKVAIVTGGGRGIGEVIARTLAGSGAKVVVADIDLENAHHVAAEIGDAARAIHLDVANEQSWTACVEETVAAFGSLNVLVNNAGIGSMAPIEDETLEGWNRTVSVDETGVWLGMRICGAEMKRHGGGSIVNIGSVFALVGTFGGSIAYHAAKGAVRMMSKSAAIFWGPQGIRVNTVHPAVIRTPMFDELGAAFAGRFLDHTPIGRLGEAQDIANGVAFLASDLSSFITGIDLPIDGGWTAD